MHYNDSICTVKQIECRLIPNMQACLEECQQSQRCIVDTYSKKVAARHAAVGQMTAYACTAAQYAAGKGWLMN